tara:strand:+ start:4626 stop:4922 length:297 start_codon:yes stop_codon:yes gene_type:complete
MYKDLADAVESMKEQGFINTFKISDNVIICSNQDRNFNIHELTILESYSHQSGTDPGNEATVYSIESKDGVKGTLIIGFGIYSDPTKAKLIDKLLSKG